LDWHRRKILCQCLWTCGLAVGPHSKRCQDLGYDNRINELNLRENFRVVVEKTKLDLKDIEIKSKRVVQIYIRNPWDSLLTLTKFSTSKSKQRTVFPRGSNNKLSVNFLNASGTVVCLILYDEIWIFSAWWLSIC